MLQSEPHINSKDVHPACIGEACPLRPGAGSQGCFFSSRACQLPQLPHHETGRRVVFGVVWHNTAPPASVVLVHWKQAGVPPTTTTRLAVSTVVAGAIRPPGASSLDIKVYILHAQVYCARHTHIDHPHIEPYVHPKYGPRIHNVDCSSYRFVGSTTNLRSSSLFAARIFSSRETRYAIRKQLLQLCETRLAPRPGVPCKLPLFEMTEVRYRVKCTKFLTKSVQSRQETYGYAVQCSQQHAAATPRLEVRGQVGHGLKHATTC